MREKKDVLRKCLRLVGYLQFVSGAGRCTNQCALRARLNGRPCCFYLVVIALDYAVFLLLMVRCLFILFFDLIERKNLFLALCESFWKKIYFWVLKDLLCHVYGAKMKFSLKKIIWMTKFLIASINTIKVKVYPYWFYWLASTVKFLNNFISYVSQCSS